MKRVYLVFVIAGSVTSFLFWHTECFSRLLKVDKTWKHWIAKISCPEVKGTQVSQQAFVLQRKKCTLGKSNVL